jgi:hypothetical protein
MKMPSEEKSTGRSLAWASTRKPSALMGTLNSSNRVLVLVGQHGRGQNQQVGIELDGPAQDVILDRHAELVAVGRHLGRRFQIEADEDHAQFPGLAVQVFTETIGADVPVENEDIHPRLLLLEC